MYPKAPGVVDRFGVTVAVQRQRSRGVDQRRFGRDPVEGDDFGGQAVGVEDRPGVGDDVQRTALNAAVEPRRAVEGVVRPDPADQRGGPVHILLEERSIDALRLHRNLAAVGDVMVFGVRDRDRLERILQRGAEGRVQPGAVAVVVAVEVAEGGEPFRVKPHFQFALRVDLMDHQLGLKRYARQQAAHLRGHEGVPAGEGFALEPDEFMFHGGRAVTGVGQFPEVAKTRTGGAVEAGDGAVAPLQVLFKFGTGEGAVQRALAVGRLIAQYDAVQRAAVRAFRELSDDVADELPVKGAGGRMQDVQRHEQMARVGFGMGLFEPLRHVVGGQQQRDLLVVLLRPLQPGFDVIVIISEVGFQFPLSARLRIDAPRADFKLNHIAADPVEERHVPDRLLEVSVAAEHHVTALPVALFVDHFRDRKTVPVLHLARSELPAAGQGLAGAEQRGEVVERGFDLRNRDAPPVQVVIALRRGAEPAVQVLFLQFDLLRNHVGVNREIA